MDRRKQKTRNEIFDAFIRLLHQKRYSNISVKDIIDEANVGRATFYNHFETKDSLLHAFCENIFEHVFHSDHGCGIPIELDSSYTLEERLTHIFYHFKSSKKDILSILNSEDADLFWSNFRPYIQKLFSAQIADKNLPQNFLESYYTGSFLACVQWWIRQNMRSSEQDMAHYFLQAANLGEAPEMAETALQ